MKENEIPILEYDSDPNAVIMPNHANLSIKLPRKAVFAFLGDYIDKYALSRGATVIANFDSATKRYPIYLLCEKGKNVCLVQAPVGASCAVQLLDWLISYGIREVISAGSCGVLVDYPENLFLVPYQALRDEGTSYHYLPPSRYVNINEKAKEAIISTLKEHNLPYSEVKTWTTDGFFRETKSKVLLRKKEGIEAVEMECSALASCAQMRGILWGEILYTADTLSDISNYDERNWGEDSIEYAIELCLQAVLRI